MAYIDSKFGGVAKGLTGVSLYRLPRYLNEMILYILAYLGEKGQNGPQGRSSFKNSVTDKTEDKLQGLKNLPFSLLLPFLT